MKNTMKRVMIALILPLLITGVISGVMFRINSYAGIKEVTEEPQGEGVVKITPKNWQEYFTVGQDVELIRDENDEVTMVKYVFVIGLKEEYRDRINDEEANEVTFHGNCETKKMAYEITDAKAGEWEITGDVETVYYWNDGDDGRHIRIWSDTYEMDDYVLKSELWSGSTIKNPLALEVPQEEWKIDAVNGYIYLK